MLGTNDFGFEILEHFGVISKIGSSWTKEFNLVSWNGNEPKYDIRDWNSDHTRMTNGITFKADELKALIEILKTMEV